MQRNVRGRERAFNADVNRALVIVCNAESWSGGTRSPTTTELEYLYESAYIYIFARWEAFLEEAFLRFMCGYVHSGTGRKVTLSPGSTYFSTLSAARTSLYKGKQFMLWHGAAAVVARSRSVFQAGPHEVVLQSAYSELQDFSAIRHRIAHDHADAKSKFSQAALNLSGSAWRGKRPGHFLRRFASTQQANSGAVVTPNRWVDKIGSVLQGLASQIS